MAKTLKDKKTKRSNIKEEASAEENTPKKRKSSTPKKWDL
jgi:hypothetical protein